VEAKLGDKAAAFTWDPWPSKTRGNSYAPHGAGSLISFWTRENLKGVYQLGTFDEAAGKGLKLRYRLAVPPTQGGEPVELLPEAVEGK
jgi:hypothetical protein